MIAGDDYLLNSLFYIVFSLYTVTDFAKMINQDYSNLLTAFFSCLLLVVTTVYVICTYIQVGISKKSIKLNIEYLKQLESEHKTSVTPILVPNKIKAHGGACYPAFNGLSNRKLFVFWDTKNIGNSPAIQIYNKVEFKLKYIEGDDRTFSSDYRYAGSLAINKTGKASTDFDGDKLSMLLADISAMINYNTNIIKKGNGEKLATGTTLVINCVYTNIHGQYFKTIY